MRKITISLFFAASVLVGNLAGAAAEGHGPSECKDERPGQFISAIARTEGHSGTANPGSGKGEFRPFVPFDEFEFGCNPTVDEEIVF